MGGKGELVGIKMDKRMKSSQLILDTLLANGYRRKAGEKQTLCDSLQTVLFNKSVCWSD